MLAPWFTTLDFSDAMLVLLNHLSEYFGSSVAKSLSLDNARGWVVVTAIAGSISN
jgi:hypothetical protein